MSDHASILVVDDEPHVSDMLQEFFSSSAIFMITLVWPAAATPNARGRIVPRVVSTPSTAPLAVAADAGHFAVSMMSTPSASRAAP